LLPEIYRRHDVVRRPALPAAPAIPEAEDTGGQLRRFLESIGSATDYLRSRMESLLDVHDVTTVEARWLPLMARWIGWDLNYRASVPEQRHEIRYAPALYRLTGTIPGSKIWVRRLTGWDAEIKEFGRNVFFSNDLGNPDDPTDKGSRTVDTADAALVSKIHTLDDDVDYTYDTGTDNDAWYAYNTVGIFLQPAVDATAADVARQSARLLANVSIFLPVNVRGVVIPDLPTSVTQTNTGYRLLSAEDT